MLVHEIAEKFDFLKQCDTYFQKFRLMLFSGDVDALFLVVRSMDLLPSWKNI